MTALDDAEGAVHVTLPPPFTGHGPADDAVALATARSLLRVENRADAAAVVAAAVERLGGELAPAWMEPRGALPLDVSLGLGEPLLVVPTTPDAAGRLASALPAIVEDALAAATRCDNLLRQAWRASVDELTGVASRRETMPRLREAQPGDVVCILDLDHFKSVNDRGGHGAGDDALRRFGRLLQECTRADDFVGRYGGDEFIVVMARTTLTVAVRRLTDISAQWRRAQVAGPTVSGGAAAVDARGGSVAIAAADRALYVAKQRGRDRIEVAEEDA